MKRVAIVQSNYIPWKGYFDLVRHCDEFILYDDVQYTRRDWRNRNRIKTPTGPQWLTIPVEVSGKYHQRIRDTRICDPDWGRKHWTTLCHNYAKAPFFGHYRDFFEPLYLGTRETFLSEVNRTFIAAIAPLVGAHTRLRWSSDYPLAEGRSARLVQLCVACEATLYLSGPAAKGYLDETLFTEAGIRVEWMDYSEYPEYPQLFGPFRHDVSILDLLFNTGPDAVRYMKPSWPHE
ncbi:MAG: WbqC family protein [Usitatibacter sp.]